MFRLAVRRAWLAIIVVLVVVIALEALLTWQATAAIGQLRQREFEVVRSSRTLRGGLPDLLNSSYGYLLTQDAGFLDDLAEDRRQVQVAFARLRGAVLTDEGAALVAPIGQRLDVVLLGVDRRIELVRISRPDEARRQLLAARGEQEELFALIDSLVAAEERLFSEQLAALQRKRMLGLAVAAALLAALAGLTYRLLRQSQRRLATAHRDLEQARAEAERAANRTMRLQAVTARLSSASIPAEVAEIATEQGVEALGASAGLVALVAEDGASLEIARAVGYPPATIDAWRHVQLDASAPLAEAVVKREAVWVESRAELQARYPAVAAQADDDHRALACLPLAADGRALGVLGLSFDQERRFGVADHAYMIALAQLCAQALERARLYEAEQQARARATSILESIGDAFFALDRDWRFAYVNRAAERMLQLSRDDLLGAEIWTAYPQLAGAAFEREARAAAKERATRQFEVFFEPLDLWWEVSVFPAPDGLSVYLHDISERKRAEAEMARLLEQMRVAEARYRGLFEGIDDAIIVADAQGRFIDANPAATALLGYSRDELLAMAVGDLGAAGAAESRARFETLEREGRLRGEFELRRKDGSVVPTDSWQTAVRLPTTVVYVAVWRDISERRALELLQREFLAMVTHELKTPLTTIGAYAQFMRRRGAYNETAAETIITQSRRLDRLIEDLLDVSRLDAGRAELRREPIDLGPVVRAAAEQARVLSPAHQIEVVVPEEPVIGWFDRDRLTQILQNLLSNAVKYSPEASRVSVTLENLGDRARLTVADQGMGIPPDALPRLFSRFFRTPAAQAGRAQGLGLGLYITKGLVEAHGGQIAVESTEGVGSSFIVTLPFLPQGRR
jgi:PAS domain S-box-containing protein